MSATPTVRLLQVEDLSDALDLWRSTPGVGLSSADEPSALTRFLQRNPRTSFIAESAGRLVGTILCGQDGRRGLIYHLAVDPRFRRSGVGRSLLRAGLDALRSEGIDKCHLLVYKNNDAGLAFWRALDASERSELTLFSMGTDTSR